MLKTIILCALTAIAAFAQSQTPLTVYQNQGTLPGQLWLQEKRTDGQHWWKLSVPALSGDRTFLAPANYGASGECLKDTDGAGTLGFGACGGSVGETYLVTTYGAVCDGTTDDAAAIQDAVDAAQSAGGGTIVLPYGTCAIGSQIDITNNFIGFRGQGRSMSVLLGQHNGPLLHVDTATGDIYAFEVSNMTLQPNGGNISSAIVADGANDFMRSAFHNLYIANGRRGLWVKNDGFADWIHFRDNICDMTLVTDGTCLDIETGLTSPGGIIANNQFIQGSGGTAIYYHGDFGDIVISGNHSESGAYFLNADCDTGGTPACTYGERLTVTGNKIDNATQPIRIDTVQNSRITGNVVLGGIAAPVEVVGASSGLEIDEDYNQGKRYIGANGSTQVSPAKILLGDHTIDAANTDVGLSVIDTTQTSAIGVGQSLARSAGLAWSYDATPANAYGLLYTFGASNSMKYIASFHKFTGDIYPESTDTYILGSTSLRWASIAATDVNFGGGLGSITFLPGAAPTVGDCWLASSTGGEGNWGACTGGGWTVSGSDVYRATGSVGIGVTSPASALHMSATNVAIFMDGYSSVAPNILMRQSNGSAGSETATVAGDRIGQVAMAGYGTARVTAARIGAYAGSNFTGSNAESYIRFDTTASGSTTVTERWRLLGGGNLVSKGSSTIILDRATRATNQKLYFPVAENTATTGAWSAGTTPSGAASRFVVDHNGTEHLVIDESGLASFSAGISAVGAVGAVNFNGTGSNPFRVSGTGVIDSSRNASFVNLTLSGTVTADLIPTTSNVYVLGSSSSYWNQIAGATLFVEGVAVRPRTGGSGTVGISTARFSKAWLQDIDFTGTLTAPSGNTGAAATLTCGAGQAVKNITVSGGIVTSVSCGTP